MSQNNLIKKSDKKFIRSEKARIRRGVLGIKKQEELISELYKRFIGKNSSEKAAVPEKQIEAVKKTEVKKEKAVPAKSQEKKNSPKKEKKYKK